jgi:hypothetical protein
MGKAKRLGWLILLICLGPLSGCGLFEYAPSLAELDPEASPRARVLAADWDRMGSSESMALHGPRHPPGPTQASGPPPQAPALAIPAAVADASALPAPARSLWSKQPWEVELDKTVRSICQGC